MRIIIIISLLISVAYGQSNIGVLIYGQSNATGYAGSNDLTTDERGGHNNVRLWGGASMTEYEFSGTGAHGLEPTLGGLWNYFFPNDTLIMYKKGSSGQGLDDFICGSGNWGTVITHLGNLTAVDTLHHIFFVYLQGETEAGDTAWSNYYYDSMQIAYDCWKEALIHTYGYVDTVYYIHPTIRINPAITPGDSGRAVRQIITQLAADRTDVYSFNTAEPYAYEYVASQAWHYETPGFRRMAYNILNIMKAIIRQEYNYQP